MTVTRRVVLGWMAGLGAWLAAGAPAEAKPKRRRAIYTDLYSDLH